MNKKELSFTWQHPRFFYAIDVTRVSRALPCSSIRNLNPTFSTMNVSSSFEIREAEFVAKSCVKYYFPSFLFFKKFRQRNLYDRYCWMELIIDGNRVNKKPFRGYFPIYIQTPLLSVEINFWRRRKKVT